MTWSTNPCDWSPKETGLVLLGYLFLVGIPAVTLLLVFFPAQKSPVWQMLLAALLAGMVGSLIHAGQSLSSFLGNQKFLKSWTAWYLLRPWIGGILGFTVVVVVNAGFVGSATVANNVGSATDANNADTISPFSNVAFALLAGWFSKTASDKMQEVVAIVFKSNEDRKRKNKMTDDGRPVIERLDPATLARGQNEFTIHGKNFMSGASVLVGDSELQPQQPVSDKELKVTLPAGFTRPAAGAIVKVKVKNPSGSIPLSDEMDLTFN